MDRPTLEVARLALEMPEKLSVLVLPAASNEPWWYPLVPTLIGVLVGACLGWFAEHLRDRRKRNREQDEELLALRVAVADFACQTLHLQKSVSDAEGSAWVNAVGHWTNVLDELQGAGKLTLRADNILLRVQKLMPGKLHDLLFVRTQLDLLRKLAAAVGRSPRAVPSRRDIDDLKLGTLCQKTEDLLASVAMPAIDQSLFRQEAEKLRVP